MQKWVCAVIRFCFWKIHADEEYLPEGKAEDKMVSILIVDDQPYVRKLVSKSLTSDGYQITTLYDASLAWEYIRKFQLDLLLLNSLSEGFDSFELLMDIKSEYPKFPVLIYVIRSLNAIDSLKEAIIGVVNENRLPNRTKNLDALAWK
jgi:CheY-like chemotaxis protein